MMTDRLRAFVERAQKLPADTQNRLMDELDDLLDDAEWHALLADPRSDAVLDKLIAEAKRSPKRPWPTPADMGDAE